MNTTAGLVLAWVQCVRLYLRIWGKSYQYTAWIQWVHCTQGFWGKSYHHMHPSRRVDNLQFRRKCTHRLKYLTPHLYNKLGTMQKAISNTIHQFQKLIKIHGNCLQTFLAHSLLKFHLFSLVHLTILPHISDSFPSYFRNLSTCQSK